MQWLFAFCTSWKVSEVVQRSTSTRLAFPATKNNSGNRPQKFTIDIPSINPPKKFMEEYWLLLALMLRLAISSASLNIFLLKLSTTIFPFPGPSNLVDRWRKLLHVRRRQSYPAGPHRWLGRKIFFCPISGTEFDHFWNWLGKNKFPGALRLLK